MPRLDWESDAHDPVTQLNQVADKDVREVLERELWSYRQLFASVGRTDLVDRLQNVHRQAFGASRANNLDLHAVRGVEYHPAVQPEAQVDEARLGQFVGVYVLSDRSQAEGGVLPAQVSIEMKQGKLFGMASDEGCISLVPITPTRFAIPENPGMCIEFHMDGDKIREVTVEAGGVAVVYEPGD